MQALKPWSGVAVCLWLALPVAWAQVPAAEPAAAPTSAPADPTAVLKVIPADASGFVAIPSLKGMDAHVQGVAQQLQLQGLIPSPLDLIKRNTGVSVGLDENGGMAFVVLSLSEAKTPDELAQKLAFFVPATKPDEMIKSLGGEKDGDFFKVNVMGQATLATAKEGFVVLAEKPETLKAALEAKGGVIKAMSEEQVKAFTRDDLIAWANPSTISKEIRDQVVQRIRGMMSSAGPFGSAAASQPASGGEELVKMIEQLQEASLGVSLNQAKGLTIDVFTRAKAGTELAKDFAATKGSTKPLLVGLPNEATILAFGKIATGEGPGRAETVNQQISQVFKIYTSLLSTAGIQIAPEKLDTLKQPLVQLLVGVQQIAVELSALPVEGGEGRLGFTLVATVKDSAGWKGDARKFFENLKQLVVDVAKQKSLPEEKIKMVADAVTWKENAEQIEGTSVDHFLVDLDKIAETESEKQNLEKVKTFLGKEGVLVRIAAAGDHALITFGGGAPRFTAAMAAVKKNVVLSAENQSIKKIADRLPTGPRVMEGYFSVDNLLNLVSTAAAQLGSPLPMPLQLNNAAPIALVTVKVGDTAQDTVVLLPMELISGIKEMVGPMLMMMGPGGMPESTEPAPKPSGELK